MFCEGLSLDATGRIVATGGCSNRAYTGLELTMAGGNDAAKTSIYDPLTSAWTAEGLMQIARGYQSVSKHLQVNFSYILSRRTGHKSKALRKPVFSSQIWSKESYTDSTFVQMVTLSNGNLFTIGGSWSGGSGGKNGNATG